MEWDFLGVYLVAPASDLPLPVAILRLAACIADTIVPSLPLTGPRNLRRHFDPEFASS